MPFINTHNDDIFTVTGGPLQPHEYVIIRREMTAGDAAWIENHSATLGGTTKKPVPQLTVGNIKLAALKRMILGWQLDKTVTGTDGTPTTIQRPFSSEEIEKLPRRIAAFINKKIDELNPEDEDDEDFTSAADAPSGSN